MESRLLSPLRPQVARRTPPPGESRLERRRQRVGRVHLPARLHQPRRRVHLGPQRHAHVALDGAGRRRLQRLLQRPAVALALGAQQLVKRHLAPHVDRLLHRRQRVRHLSHQVRHLGRKVAIAVAVVVVVGDGGGSGGAHGRQQLVLLQAEPRGAAHLAERGGGGRVAGGPHGEARREADRRARGVRLYRHLGRVCAGSRAHEVGACGTVRRLLWRWRAAEGVRKG